jgi:hypothetical protein
VNIRSIGTGTDGNNRTRFRGFRVAWPSGTTQRGFLPSSTYYSAYGIGGYSSMDYYHYGAYGPGGAEGSGLQVASTDNGRVFFASHHQQGGPGSYQSSAYGGPINGTYYSDAYYNGQVQVFDPNVGGDIHYLTNTVWTSIASYSYSYDYRTIQYIEASDDGKQIAFVHNPGSSSYYAYSYYKNMEHCGFVGNINLNATTGALLAGSFFKDVRLAQTANWPNYSTYHRYGAAMAHYALGGKFFAARDASAYPSVSDENATKIYSYEPKLVTPGTPPVVNPNEKDLGLPTRRYNVLNAAR